MKHKVVFFENATSDAFQVITKLRAKISGRDFFSRIEFLGSH